MDRTESSHRVSRGWSLAATLLCAMALSACAQRSPAVPSELAARVDASLTFEHLVANPDGAQQKLVVLGGELLRATRFSHGTELEILQLPLNDNLAPAAPRVASQGRFLALDPGGRDPATLVVGMPVTLVGEVTGMREGRLDESTYRFLTITMRSLHAWDPRAMEPTPRVRPSVGFGMGMGTGMGGMRGGGGISIGTGF
ncbi:MAG: Slp family lipoprotein [Nitrospiraceae bacterium]